MSRKSKAFSKGDKVYSELHEQNGVIIEVRTSDNQEKEPVYVVKLDNGDKRHYLAADLGGAEKDDDEEE